MKNKYTTLFLLSIITIVLTSCSTGFDSSLETFEACSLSSGEILQNFFNTSSKPVLVPLNKEIYSGYEGDYSGCKYELDNIYLDMVFREERNAQGEYNQVWQFYAESKKSAAAILEKDIDVGEKGIFFYEGSSTLFILNKDTLTRLNLNASTFTQEEQKQALIMIYNKLTN